VSGLRLPDSLSADTRAQLQAPRDWKGALIGAMMVARGGHFVDIGANVGQTLADFAASPHGASYVGFEPNPACADQVEQVIAANPQLAATLVRCGLSHADRPIRLWRQRGQSHDTTATLIADLRPTFETEAVLVPCYRFDVVAEVLAGPPPDVIKIDVEGAEALVLAGMSATLATHRPWLLCEVLHKDSHAAPGPYAAALARLEALFAAQDYAIFQVRRDGADRIVTALSPVTHFPLRDWDDESWQLCDYVMAPRADAARIAGLVRQAE
jgi:FkbM family methyltransferase